MAGSTAPKSKVSQLGLDEKAQECNSYQTHFNLASSGSHGIKHQDWQAFMQKHGPWMIRKSRQIYQDPWMDVRCDEVLRPDGVPGTFSTVRIKPGVCVIAVDDDRTVYLTREFHYAVGRVTIEGASGGIEPTESALEAAQRELREELGIVANRWSHLGHVDPFTSALESPTQLFLAEELQFVEPDCEPTELIERVAFPIGHARQLVIESTITHAPTCVAILKAADRFGCLNERPSTDPRSAHLNE